MKFKFTYNLIIMGLLVLCFVSFSNLVSAQQGGGGRLYIYDDNFCTGDFNIYNQTTGDCEVNMSSFTGCLIKNCDYFCKDYGMSGGEYYEHNLCWCEEFQLTIRGKILKDSGWIEIEECVIQKEINPTDIKCRLKEVFKIILKSVIGIIIGLYLLVGFYKLYKIIFRKVKK